MCGIQLLAVDNILLSYLSVDHNALLPSWMVKVHKHIWLEHYSAPSDQMVYARICLTTPIEKLMLLRFDKQVKSN